MTAKPAMTIGEAAKRAGVTPKTIRFYEDAGIIKPAGRTQSGYRVYSEKNLRVLQFVQRARTLGFSLKDVAGLIKLYDDDQRASANVKALALHHLTDLNRRIDDMIAIRDTIATLVDRCPGGAQPDCPILNDLEGSGGRSGSPTLPVRENSTPGY